VERKKHDEIVRKYKGEYLMEEHAEANEILNIYMCFLTFIKYTILKIKVNQS
jgi:hypothetical protein